MGRKEDFIPPRISNEEAINALRTWGVNFGSQVIREDPEVPPSASLESHPTKKVTNTPKGIDLGRQDIRFGKQWW